MAKLRLDSVSKIFPTSAGYVTAIHDVNLDVGNGEFVCLLGTSGCGKTTVLNLVAGFIEPTYGTITLDGEPIRGPGPDRGVVFQQHAVFPWMTVEQNVAFGLRSRGIDKGTTDETVHQYLEMVGLWQVRGQWPKALSGGMKQRVAIARALANDPKVLLMDEPFGALDAQTRRNMQEETERIWLKTKRTTIFVTHSLDEAILLGDRIALMGVPGHIVRILDVDLPRPRDEGAAAFVALRRKLETELIASTQTDAPRSTSLGETSSPD